MASSIIHQIFIISEIENSTSDTPFAGECHPQAFISAQIDNLAEGLGLRCSHKFEHEAKQL
ncbi:MAG: hypothetical protein DWI06_00320 [Planctomycetota bacterium]|nr:MAG: hypothetical protein DWI06_00320 [Planctomycetota bacterium]